MDKYKDKFERYWDTKDTYGHSGAKKLLLDLIIGFMIVGGIIIVVLGIIGMIKLSTIPSELVFYYKDNDCALCNSARDLVASAKVKYDGKTKITSKVIDDTTDDINPDDLPIICYITKNRPFVVNDKNYYDLSKQANMNADKLVEWIKAMDTKARI